MVKRLYILLILCILSILCIGSANAALTDTSKIDFSFKNLFNILFTSTDKAFYEENQSAFNGPIADLKEVWSPSTRIPNSVGDCPIPSICVNVSDVNMTEDISVAGSKTWNTGFTDWIPPSYGGDYTIGIFCDDGGGGLGTQLSTTDTSCLLYTSPSPRD